MQLVVGVEIGCGGELGKREFGCKVRRNLNWEKVVTTVLRTYIDLVLWGIGHGPYGPVSFLWSVQACPQTSMPRNLKYVTFVRRPAEN